MAATKSRNETPNTPAVSESKIARMKVDELRRKLKDRGVKGTADLKKPELVKKMIKTELKTGGKNPTTRNDTPATPEVSESKIARMKASELRSGLAKRGVKGTDEMKKPELVAKFVKSELKTAKAGAKAGKSAKSAKAAKSARAAKTVSGGKSASAPRAAKSASGSKSGKAASAAKSGSGSKSGKAASAAKSVSGSKSGKAASGAKSGSATKSVKSATPAQSASTASGAEFASAASPVKSGSGAKGAAVAKVAKAAGKARAGKGAKSPERAGRILVTTDHEVIRQWAKARGAVPSAVAGTQRNGQLGVLRFDLPGYSGDRLVEVSWAEWFEAFDKRRLNFIYQERRPSGGRSTFFQLENPDQ